MWNNNGFHGNGNFQPNDSLSRNFQQINPLSENFLQGFADNFIPLSAGDQVQQHFRPDIFMSDQSGQLIEDDYRPETGFNNGFNQNSTLNSPDPHGQYTPPPAQTTVAPRPALDPTAMNLKAKLMRARERAKSGTPPSAMIGSKPSQITDGDTSTRDSPNISAGLANSGKKSGSPNQRSVVKLTDEDFEDLISGATSGLSSKIKKEDLPPIEINEPKSQKSPPGPKVHSNGEKNNATSRIISNPEKLNINENENLNGKTSSKNLNNTSDVSDEGEIREPVITKITSITPTGPKETQPKYQARHSDEQVLRKSRDDEVSKYSQRPDSHARSPPRRSRTPLSRPRDTSLHSRDERYDDADEKPERRTYETHKPTYSSNYERKSEPEPRSFQRRDSRDVAEDHRQEPYYEKKEVVQAKPKPPTLEDLLEVDEDLRDWLQITDYHNVEKRSKTLNRRRALAALDAQRAKILEEEEMEERGGSKAPSTTIVSSSMPPPLVPVKIPAPAVVTPSKKAEERPNQIVSNRSTATSNPDAGSKRSYSEFRDSRDARDDSRAEKVNRHSDRGHNTSMKTEEDDNDHRLYSRGRHSPRRRSASPPPKSHGWDDKTVDERGRQFGPGRSHNRERDRSLGLEAYESRPAARSFSGSDDYPGRLKGNDRPYVERGGYRGRAYDPLFHLKKGGRGRGSTSWTNSEPERPEYRSQHPYQPGGYGTRIANMNPYRDPIGFEKGGRGDTRYFIVKSFNEENVIRCIDDSIWTTQVHNGEMFKEAFETCKNVILVFSINQSHAFQGYARMENLPGSEKAPLWQNNINWESTGAFKVRWLTIAVTRFSRVHHLKNSLNENMAVLVAKDGQEVEERCGAKLLRCIDEEFDGRGGDKRYRDPGVPAWDP